MAEKEREPTLTEALVDSSVDGLIAVDRELRYTLWNRAMERFAGKRADEVLGRYAFDVFPFLRDVGLDREIGRALAGETVYVEAVPQKRADGTFEYFDRHYGPLVRDGEVIGVLGVVRDVTQGRRMEAELREREELFRSVVENASESIAIVDATGAPLYANPALLRILGWSWDELKGMTVLDLAHPDDLARAAEGMIRMVNDVGSTVFLDARWRAKDGSWRALDGHSRSFLNRDGAINVVLHARDVTEERRTRAALRDTEERLRAAAKMEAIGRLAGGVAHDFNNLLTVIIGCAELLAHCVPPSSTMSRHVADVQRAAERGAALTRQLLTFSRREPARSAGVVALDAVVGEMGTMLLRLIGEHIELVTRLEAGPRGRVRIDEGQIEQVLLNLVLNARDALGAGGGRITVATSIDGERAILRVSDDGCGMSDEVKQHLFEPFFTTKPRGQGTGLGLATVYGIATQAGGEVGVESAPGAGATFEVRLPLARDEVARAATPSTAPNARGHETVLLVEDEAPLRRLIREVLTDSGYAVLEAANGDEALRAVDERAKRDERVDLLLSDVVMPGMTGRQLAQRVRSTWPSARVLLMSGYDDGGGAGPDEAILGKPFTASALAARVREALDAG